jgi:hypothetical protein
MLDMATVRRNYAVRNTKTDIEPGNIIFMCNIPLVKVKVKFPLEQAAKAQRGSRGIALLFLQPRRWM